MEKSTDTRDVVRKHRNVEENMEIYTGVKFQYHKDHSTFAFDERLAELNTWAFTLAGLGLTPIHPGGAYGNQSYRMGRSSLIITKSGMIPEKDLVPDNYVCIEEFNEERRIFFIQGMHDPSSESILHYFIYKRFEDVGAIMHGHSGLFEQHATKLEIPVTSTFQPYGTFELAESAVELLQDKAGFIFLKGHGFVAAGKDIKTTGNLVLEYYGKLIALLRK
jgi:ribulose-5-phosphate 4-epimerase/fuculose-1-phosphate aldolase